MEDNNKIKSLETHGRKVDEQIQHFHEKIEEMAEKEERPL
jgi:hypothetical protein